MMIVSSMKENRLSRTFPSNSLLTAIIHIPTAIALLILCSFPAQAVTLARVWGVARASSSRPMAGVEIVLTNLALKSTRTTLTDNDGFFIFDRVTPGTHRILVVRGESAEGRRDIRIPGDSSVWVVLTIPDTDKGAAPGIAVRIVDPLQTGVMIPLAEAILTSLPQASVRRLEVNPLLGGRYAKYPSVTLDGFSLHDPFQHDNFLVLPRTPFANAQIWTAGRGPQHEMQSGLELDLELPYRRGFPFQVSASMAPEIANWGVSPDNWSNFRLEVSAALPLIEKKLWWTAAISGTQDSIRNLFPDTEVLDGSTKRDNQLQQLIYITQLIWQATEQHQMGLALFGHPSWNRNAENSYRVHPEAESGQDVLALGGVLSWKAKWTDRLFQETKLSYDGIGQDDEPQSGCTSLTDVECRGQHNMATGERSGNFTELRSGRQHIFEVDSSISLAAGHWLGSHTLASGFGYRYADYSNGIGFPGGGFYKNYGPGASILDLQVPDRDGTVRLVWNSSRGSRLSLFLEDQWEFSRRWIIKPGVRVEKHWFKPEGGASSASQYEVCPHIHQTLSLTEDRRTIFRFGYDRYLGSNMWLAMSIPRTQPAVYSYMDSSGSGIYDRIIQEQGGRTVAEWAWHPWLTSREDELYGQLEREIFPWLSLAGAVHRTWVQIPPGSKTPILGDLSRPGSSWNSSRQGPSEIATTDVSVSLRADFGPNRKLALSYQHSKTVAALSPEREFVDTVVEDQVEYPRRLYDFESYDEEVKSHRIELLGALELPWHLRTGLNFGYTKHIGPVVEFDSNMMFLSEYVYFNIREDWGDWSNRYFGLNVFADILSRFDVTGHPWYDPSGPPNQPQYGKSLNTTLRYAIWASAGLRVSF